VLGDTVAYWRFEEGPATSLVAHGGLPDGQFYAGVADSSGHGNALSAWSDGGWANSLYTTDRPGSIIPQTGAANNFAIKNAGGYPGMFTQTGAAIQSITPSAFTIEASFKPENGDYRTIVGRDSRGTNTAPGGNGDLAALYLQIVPGNAVAIKFCDAAGYWHEAVSAPGAVQGFNWGSDPDGLTGHWYNMAAVSDGSLLSLYLNSGAGYQLVAQTDMATSGSTNTALTAGAGDGGDWDAGNWSVGRGLYAGGHGDRAYGFIDEVRISDSAMTPDQLITPEPASLAAFGFLAVMALRRRGR